LTKPHQEGLRPLAQFKGEGAFPSPELRRLFVRPSQRLLHLSGKSTNEQLGHLGTERASKQHPGRPYPKSLNASIMHRVGTRKTATINSVGGMRSHR